MDKKEKVLEMIDGRLCDMYPENKNPILDYFFNKSMKKIRIENMLINNNFKKKHFQMRLLYLHHFMVRL